MKIKNIGVMSPGDMGQAVAQHLKANGFNVSTALDKRSARSKTLAQQAGLTDVGSLEKLIAQSDVILSIVPPAAALAFANEFAETLGSMRREMLFVDCNAVAPDVMQGIGKKITAAGGRCVDAGIVGSPPRGAIKMSLYVSGPGARDLEQLATSQIAVPVVSDRIGDASSVKLCYSAMAKGTTAMVAQLMIVARRLGIDAVLEKQFAQSHSAIFEKIMGGLPVVPPKAHRFVPEILELARTFETMGMSPRMYEGVAEFYKYVATTDLGKETPENYDKSRSGRDVFRTLADKR